MLRVTTRGLLGREYDLRLDGRDVASWSGRGWSKHLETPVDGRPAVLRTDGRKRFVLDTEPGAVCELTHHDRLFGHSTWSVTTGKITYELAATGMRDMAVRRDGRDVGSVRRRGLLTSEYTADLPAELPPVVQVFVAWVVIVIRTRAATAAMAAGAGA